MQQPGRGRAGAPNASSIRATCRTGARATAACRHRRARRVAARLPRAVLRATAQRASCYAVAAIRWDAQETAAGRGAPDCFACAAVRLRVPAASKAARRVCSIVPRRATTAPNRACGNYPATSAAKRTAASKAAPRGTVNASSLGAAAVHAPPATTASGATLDATREGTNRAWVPSPATAVRRSALGAGRRT